MNDQEIINSLKQASEGLLFMSESEYPLDVFIWELPAQSLTSEQVSQQTGHAPDAPVETVGLDEFFSIATTEQDWYEAEEKENVKKVQQLVETIKSRLQKVNVYRIGKRTIDVYIVGKTESGSWAGLSTKVVET
jgi:hypothetical protein